MTAPAGSLRIGIGEARHPLGSAIAGGVFAAFVSYAIHLFIWTVSPGDELSRRFLGAHFATCVVVYVVLAVALRRSAPTLDVALLLLPVIAATSTVLAVYWRLGAYSRLVLFALVAVAVLRLLSIRWRRLAPQPLVAAAVGAALGTWLGRLRLEWRGSRTDPVLLLLTVLLVLAGLAIVEASRRRLNRPLSPLLACLCVALATLWAPKVPKRFRPPETATATYPPVALIVLDTVRADHLREYGYGRDTMPHLSAFASREAVVVRDSTANASWTAPSHASLFTGLYPPRNGMYGATVAELGSDKPGLTRLRDDVPTLASVLARHGFWTAAIVANHAVLSRATGLDRGFHLYRALRDGDKAARRSSPWSSLWTIASAVIPHRLQMRLGVADLIFDEDVGYRRAPAITAEALAVLDGAGPASTFLFVNFLDAHKPYLPPEQCRVFEGVRPDAELGGPHWQAVARGRLLERSGRLSVPQREHLVALYDASLRCMDDSLGRLLDALRRHRRWQDALVVVTSDHGEALGQHYYLDHGGQLYAELLRVPLVIKLPSMLAGKADALRTAMVQSVDVFATILAVLGLPTPPTIDGWPFGDGRTHALAWQGAEDHRSGRARFMRQLRSIQDRRWKYIEDSLGKTELYDLSTDPDETIDLADQQPEIARSLAARLGPFELIRGDPVRIDADTTDALRALGYIR